MQFQNELLLVLSVALCFGGLLVMFRMFGKTGVFAWTVLETITANIEVLMLVKAFGMEMTLGNTLFASSFLATDILSELYGKKEADKGVWLGIASTLLFIIISLTWQLYIPSENDISAPQIRAVFAVTPRVMCASLIAYFASEFFDVWLYHRIWNATTNRCNNSTRFLWLRNNVATLSAQLVNTVVFTLLAFWGMYTAGTFVSIIVSTYAIYVITSFLDTPFLYLARHIGGRFLKPGATRQAVPTL